MITLNQSFSIKLSCELFQSQVAIGKFDGKLPTLVGCTTGGRIVCHSPHDKNTIIPIQYLNFNRNITAVTTGDVGNRGHDVLFIGTENSVSAYDVCKNLDVFFKDVTDGVGALSVGVIQSIGKPVLVVGGNCSILGFNNEGSEVFWTVNSDNVSSLAFSDIDSDGIVQLIVGSEDYEIRIFKGAELLSEISETDKVILLHSLPGSRFAYGLANGTIGVYNSNGQRLWKVKTKSVPTSLISCCITGKGNAEVATGWLNGNFTIRNSSDGTLLYKGSAESPIVALFYYDFKLEGKPQFILCTQSGEITGYTLAQADSISAINSAQGIISGGSKITSRTDDQQIIDQLFNTKLELLTQMNLIEKALHQFKNNGPSPRILLADTKVQFEIKPSLDDCCLHLVAMSSNEALISSLIIIDAGNIASALSLLSYKNKYVYVYMYDVDNAVTKGAGTLVWIPTTASKTAVLDLYPVKFQNCTLLIQSHISTRSTVDQLHVFENVIMLPKFACFQFVSSEQAISAVNIHGAARTRGQVVFYLDISITRLIDWLKASFPTYISTEISLDKLKVHFLSVCGPVMESYEEYEDIQKEATRGEYRPLQIIANIESDGRLKVKIRSDSMNLASEVFQDLVSFIECKELETEADFPEEIDSFDKLATRVQELNETRMRLLTDMADDSQQIKTFAVRAEDCRIRCDMKSMRKAYTSLYSLNMQLISQYKSRAITHDTLLKGLKSVNLMVQRASNLRVGKAKQDVITSCRQAVKNNNMKALKRIIKYGNVSNNT